MKLHSKEHLHTESTSHSSTKSSSTYTNLSSQSNPYMIDYPHLDLKYYPHIKSKGKYYDSDIIKIIESVDEGEKKNGIFIGIGYGGNNNIATPFISNESLIGPQPLKIGNYNPLLFSMRAGYQNYTSTVLPMNFVGFAIYLDAISSFGQGAVVFTGVNCDLLIDFFRMYSNAIIGSSLGLGIGNTKITDLVQNPQDNKFEAGYKINLGLHTLLFYHHKIHLSAQIMQGIQEGFIGAAWILGYDYVF